MKRDFLEGTASRGTPAIFQICYVLYQRFLLYLVVLISGIINGIDLARLAVRIDFFVFGRRPA